MVQIPDIPTTRRRVDTTVRGAAPSVEQAGFTGRAISALGAEASKIIQASEDRKAASYTTLQTADFQQRQITAFAEAKANPGEIDDFTDAFLTNFDKESSQIIADAPNEQAQLLSQQRFNTMRAKFQQKAVNFQSSQTIALQKAGLQQANDALGVAALTDPESIPDLLEQWNGDSAAAGAVGIADRQELLTKGRRKIITAGINSAIDTDLGLAKEILEVYKEDLTADQSFMLRRSMRAEEKRVTKELEEARKLEENQVLVESVLDGDSILDPKNKDHKDAVDDFMTEVDVMKEPEKFIAVAKRTGILPEKLKGRLNAMIVNGNAEQNVTSANIINDLHINRPLLVESMDSKSKLKASLITQHVRAGIPQGTAIEWANNAIDPNQVTRDFRNRQFRKLASGTGDVTVLEQNDDAQDFFQEGFFGVFGQPEIPPGLRAEYANLVEGYYLNNNIDIKDAQTNAARDLRALWSITQVGGAKRYIRKAPEKAYAVFNDPDLDAAWINEQLEDDLKTGAKGKFKQEDIFLDLNPDTVNTKSPNYIVLHRNKQGILEPVVDTDNNELRFIPSYTTSPAAQREIEDNKTKIRRARAKRDFFADPRSTFREEIR